MRRMDINENTGRETQPHEQGNSAEPNHDDHTRRFFWIVLAAAATVSITGNAAHAILHEPARPVVAAAVAVVPPIVLLSAVHGAAVLACAHASALFVRLIATAMTLEIALAAFRLSFTALRSLALLADIPGDEAWLVPLIIEGSMTQATVALLALAHAHRRAHATEDRSPRAEDELTSHRGGQSDTVVRTDGELRAHDQATGGSDHWATVAQRVCAQDPNRRREPKRWPESWSATSRTA